MQTLSQLLDRINSIIWGNWLLIVLLGIGLLYTVLSRFIQIRRFPYIMRKTLLEPWRQKKAATENDDDTSISSFQALCTAVASCVGSGNIVGVSTAVLAGGLGAIFWMWVAAFVGMATKYGEIILGLLYRVKDEDGHYTGGPMYYIRDGLHAPMLASLCAFFMVIQIIGGNFIQSNTISGVMQNHFHIPELVTGILLVILIFTVSAGGLKRLTHITQNLVPAMALLYVVSGLLIILFNITRLPAVLSDIVTSAFGWRPMLGGATGSMIIAMQKGIARGLYSNEAGEGSAPVIHSAANVEHPVEQGITGVTEVFLDTFVICTISGLVLGVTDVLDSGLPGSILMIHAFSTVWAPLKYLVILSLLLFCTTTLMSQWYFGFVGLNYLFGSTIAQKFKYVFPLFCLIGAVTAIDIVWTIQDIALGLLTIPNLIALIILSPQVKKCSDEYWAKKQVSS